MVRNVTALASLASLFAACILGACSSSSSGTAPSGSPDGSAPTEAGMTDSPSTTVEAGGHDAEFDGPAATTTIAKARQAGVTSSITVNAIVTGVQGPSGDQVNWYIEDPEGGPYSGVVVYCDPLAATTCPCMASCANHVAAPPIHTLVSITGSMSTYKGQVQLVPTAQTVLQMNATPPPVYMATSSDLAEGATSPYRGVYVKYPSTVTVDNLTPPALYDTQCSTDGGMELCTGCSPPSYAGFEVDGPTAPFFVEEYFFPFVPLASSPECVSASGAVPVTMGETFPFMAGILDVDPYAGKQVLSPVQPSDYGQ